MTTENTTWVPDNIHINHGLYELKIHPDHHVMLSTRVPYRLRHQVRSLATALEKMVAA